MSSSDSDIAYWIETCAATVQALDGARLSEEDERRLAQIQEWCEASPLLWNIVARIGWEINEG